MYSCHPYPIFSLELDLLHQNDLQAAARCHRIGQTRPVKVIRLAARYTVDEIVLRRSLSKLKLATAVLESSEAGSEHDVGKIAISELEEMVTFGLSRLFVTDHLIDAKSIEQVVGPSAGGQWVIDERSKEETVHKKIEQEEEEKEPEEPAMILRASEGAEAAPSPSAKIIEIGSAVSTAADGRAGDRSTSEVDAATDSIYEYMGKDYSRVFKADQAVLEEMAVKRGKLKISPCIRGNPIVFKRKCYLL